MSQQHLQPAGMGTPQQRVPGSFSPMVAQSVSLRGTLRRVDSTSSEESAPLSVNKPRTAAPAAPTPALAPAPPSARLQNAPIPQSPRQIYTASTTNSSTSSLQNFSRPSISTAVGSRSDLPLRNASPLSATPRSSIDHFRGHGRKHSQTQGSFEAYLPTAATSNLGSMANLNNTGLTASQIAAQAAMQHQTHTRQRSQTVPTPQMETVSNNSGSRRPSRGPTSPPLLSLTEASGPRNNNFGGQIYQNGLLGGSHGNAAHTAANLVFPKSPMTSPGLPPSDPRERLQLDKPIKTEKSKVKLFSRPGKIGISKDKEAKAGALPSPSKMASYTLASLQRNNFSTNSLADSMSSAASMYSMANSSSATIRAVDTPPPEKEKDKEKKHHFLSRQKHKLSSKDDHHLPLSSAASNSKPVDPSAPSSLYNFSLPPSPGPTSTSFAKSMSGLDLRHGGRALREKKKEEKSDALRESELSYQNSNEWPGPSSLGSAGGASYLGAPVGSYGYPSSLYGADSTDTSKYGLNNMGADDAWPFLKAKLLVIFEGEDLRLPVEELNRLVTTHMQRCIQKRAPSIIVEDLRDLLATGFGSLDQMLHRTPDERLIPHLVELWLFTFTSILPYMQAVFLPLDLEFSGHGPLMTREQASEYWGALPSSSKDLNGNIPASQALEVRRIVLTAYRDTVILPRFDTLKTIFSRLSLDSISLSIPTNDVLSTSPDSFSAGRPSTAMSLDPANASYGSYTTTLLGSGSSGDGSGNRSRAISNVSYGSEPSASSGLGIAGLPPPPQRPFTPSSTHPLHSQNRGQRPQTVEDSGKQITETVGRMLQCMSVLASVGVDGGGDEGSQKKMEELTRGLKLNWLGRGRMGRDRRGLVGARVPFVSANTRVEGVA